MKPLVQLSLWNCSFFLNTRKWRKRRNVCSNSSFFSNVIIVYIFSSKFKTLTWFNIDLVFMTLYLRQMIWKDLMALYFFLNDMAGQQTRQSSLGWGPMPKQYHFKWVTQLPEQSASSVSTKLTDGHIKMFLFKLLSSHIHIQKALLIVRRAIHLQFAISVIKQTISKCCMSKAQLNKHTNRSQRRTGS